MGGQKVFKRESLSNMKIKILMAALSFMSCSVIAGVKTLAHDVNGNIEVIVQSIGDTACTLKYENSDYLTNEGMPVFYTFQVELGDGVLQRGMQSWLPYGINAGQPATLSFYDKDIGKIYEYTDNISLYGALFYKMNLFTRFLAADEILMHQGAATINMPVYRKSEILDKTIKTFNNCVSNLDHALMKFCKSSADASQLCQAKKSNVNKASVNEIIKDDPVFIAAAKIKALEEARIKVAKKAKKDAAAKTRAINKALEANKALEVAKAVEAKKAFEAAVAIEVAKALRIARIKATQDAAKKVAEAKHRKKINIFADKVEAPYHLNKFGQNNPATAKITNGGFRGKVTRVHYSSSSNKDVAYYASKNGIDYSEYTYIHFDLKLISAPHDDFNLNIKMDCFASCSSGPYVIEKPRLGNWKHFRVRLQDLINNPGSNLDITNVNVPFSVFPDWGNQRDVVFQIDSVALTNY